MVEITKKDWEELKEKLEIQNKNMKLAQMQDEVLLKLCDDKIKNMPADPKPEGIDAIMKDG